LVCRKRLDLFPPLEPRAARKKHGAGRSSANGPPQNPALLLIVSIVANLVPVSLPPVRNIANITNRIRLDFYPEPLGIVLA